MAPTIAPTMPQKRMGAMPSEKGMPVTGARVTPTAQPMAQPRITTNTCFHRMDGSVHHNASPVINPPIAPAMAPRMAQGMASTMGQAMPRLPAHSPMPPTIVPTMSQMAPKIAQPMAQPMMVSKIDGTIPLMARHRGICSHSPWAWRVTPGASAGRAVTVKVWTLVSSPASGALERTCSCTGRSWPAGTAT